MLLLDFCFCSYMRVCVGVGGGWDGVGWGGGGINTFAVLALRRISLCPLWFGNHRSEKEKTGNFAIYIAACIVAH